MIITIILITLGFAILWLIILTFLKTLQKKRANEVLNKFKDKKILGISSSANFFGQESSGSTQLRGNGVLVLTNEGIYFEMWLPANQLRIPLSDIVSVETTNSFLNRTKFRPLLKINFKNEKGDFDSVAWLVKGVMDWKKGIEKLCSLK